MQTDNNVLYRTFFPVVIFKLNFCIHGPRLNSVSLISLYFVIASVIVTVYITKQNVFLNKRNEFKFHLGDNNKL